MPKVEKHTKLLSDKIQETLAKAGDMKTEIELSFDAHFDCDHLSFL